MDESVGQWDVTGQDLCPSPLYSNLALCVTLIVGFCPDLLTTSYCSAIMISVYVILLRDYMLSFGKQKQFAKFI